MKKAVIAVGIMSLLSTASYADTLAGIYIGGHIWDQSASGEFGESNSSLISYDFSNEQHGSFYAAIEHPLPFIPNLKISRTVIDTHGSTVINEGFEFDDIDFEAGAEVDAIFDANYTDYTLYYEVFDNGLFSFDFGFTARDMEGDVKVSTEVTSNAPGQDPVMTTVTGEIEESAYIPMLYASTIVGLPFTGFNVFAEGNFLAFDDSTLLDYQIGVSYELIDNLAVDVNLTVGYRHLELELHDFDDLYTDMEFKGAFAGAVIHF